jgi:hypothetical protein
MHSHARVVSPDEFVDTFPIIVYNVLRLLLLIELVHNFCCKTRHITKFFPVFSSPSSILLFVVYFLIFMSLVSLLSVSYLLYLFISSFLSLWLSSPHLTKQVDWNRNTQEPYSGDTWIESRSGKRLSWLIFWWSSSVLSVWAPDSANGLPLSYQCEPRIVLMVFLCPISVSPG